MSQDFKIHLQINRRRLILAGLFYGFLTIAVLVVFFWWADSLSDNWKLGLRIAGGLMATLIVLTGSGAMKLLWVKNAGLHITPKGIEDLSSAIGVGVVEWKNIVDVVIEPKEKIILILVKKPDEILKSSANKAIRQLLEKNLSLYKTPVILESKYLQCCFEEMAEAVETGWAKFGSKKK